MITYEQALESMNRAIEQKGADVNFSKDGIDCLYIDEDGQPSCLVGHVLVDAGVDIDVLIENNSLPWFVFKHSAELSTDAVTSRFLEHVQRAQDTGFTWGEAVKRGVRSVERMERMGKW